MSKGQTLQDPFLNSLRKDRIPVSIFLVNGIKLQGHIESFDQYVVLLKNTVSQMVYKHAISTVVPARNPRNAGTSPMGMRSSTIQSSAITKVKPMMLVLTVVVLAKSVALIVAVLPKSVALREVGLLKSVALTVGVLLKNVNLIIASLMVALVKSEDLIINHLMPMPVALRAKAFKRRVAMILMAKMMKIND